MAAIRFPLAAAVTAGVVLAAAACGASSQPGAGASSGSPVTPSASAAASHGTSSPAVSAPPPIVAVTRHGALVTLNPATGAVASTLVPSHVLGDEISVSSAGMVYFALRHGCSSSVEEVPEGGGNTAVIAPGGSVPAVSPDGTKLAYASQPALRIGCTISPTDLSQQFKIVVRTLSSGSQIAYPMVGAGQGSGLPFPISHVSWAADNQRLAVSTEQVQDNEGWGLYLVDTATAHYVMSGAGTSSVPVTGQPSTKDSYLREGVFMPNGDLFVSRACCAGVPVRNTSRLMWEVTTSGALVHQVAIGYATLDHTSLDVSSDGTWLLYLAGGTLYVSQNGARPRELTTGLVAAAWG